MYEVNLNDDNLEQLFERSEGVNSKILAHHAQAAVFCLQKQGHNSPKQGKVEGDWSASMNISWEQESQEDLEKNWEEEDATEWGAVVIALSLVVHKNYRVSKRAQRRLPDGKTTAFDYWLENNSNNPSRFEDTVRLEISGILKGTESKINRRVREKTERIEESELPNYRAIILVVEFSNPKAKVCQIY